MPRNYIGMIPKIFSKICDSIINIKYHSALLLDPSYTFTIKFEYVYSLLLII